MGWIPSMWSRKTASPEINFNLSGDGDGLEQNLEQSKPLTEEIASDFSSINPGMDAIARRAEQLSKQFANHQGSPSIFASLSSMPLPYKVHECCCLPLLFSSCWQDL